MEFQIADMLYLSRLVGQKCALSSFLPFSSSLELRKIPIH